MAKKKFPIGGNCPAVVTPFNADGDIMYEDFAKLVAWHIDMGADTIVVAGDNGESWSLSLEERGKLAATAVKTAAGRVPVVMGASAISAKQTIAYAESAANAGVTGLMIGPQYYVMKATTKELVQRFQTLTKAVPLPIMLYNSPRRTNISLTIDSMRAITEAAPIVALKEASREWFYVSHVIHEFGDKLAVLMGPNPYIIPGIMLGASGFVSSGPELFGGLSKTFMSFADKPMTAETRLLHWKLTKLYECLMGTGTWPAALKAGHHLIGLPAGVPRDPVQPLDKDGLATLTAVMTEIGILPGESGRKAAE